MDFVRLGPRYTNDYKVDLLIEGYNSLIWTERLLEHGEFELKSFDVLGMMTLLPEDTLVSHIDTQEVMIVETHEIALVGDGEDAQPEITVRGRSASAILEHRWVESTYQKKRPLRRRYTAAAAGAVLIYNSVNNSSGFDVTRGDSDPDTGTVNSYDWNTKDILPNVVVTISVANEGSTRLWHVEQGTLWPQLQTILADKDLGLRILRPKSPNPATVATVRTALAQRGEVVRTFTADVSQLRFDIFSGVDRSDSVQFSQLQGHLDKPQYLMSSKEHKTALEVMSDEVEIKDVYLPGEVRLTGWERKVMGFDAGSPEIPKGVSATKRARIVADFKEEQQAAALAALKASRRVDMFSGDVSTLSPFSYKTHYDLGDTVMLFGDYGKAAKMVVSEYVRTEDVNGDRGFPGLVAPLP